MTSISRALIFSSCHPPPRHTEHGPDGPSIWRANHPPLPPRCTPRSADRRRPPGLPELFRPFRVPRDDRVRAVEDDLGRAVVLLALPPYASRYRARNRGCCGGCPTPAYIDWSSSPTTDRLRCFAAARIHRYWGGSCPGYRQRGVPTILLAVEHIRRLSTSGRSRGSRRSRGTTC